MPEKEGITMMSKGLFGPNCRKLQEVYFRTEMESVEMQQTLITEAIRFNFPSPFQFQLKVGSLSQVLRLPLPISADSARGTMLVDRFEGYVTVKVSVLRPEELCSQPEFIFPILVPEV